MQPRFKILGYAALLCTVLVASQMVAVAQETSTSAAFVNAAKDAVPINVLVGQSRLITFDKPIGRFSVSNPEVAEAVLISSQQVVVNGKGFGQVNFIAWAKDTDQFIVFDVYVRTNLSLIDSQIRALFPKDDIRLSQANGSVVISGSVTDPKTVAQVDAVVQAAGFKTVNMLQSPVKSATQVQLQVRVAEVSRNKLRDLGASFSYQGSPGAGGYINSGAGPSSLGSVTNGVLSGTIGSSLNLFLMGGNTLNMIRALQQQGALRALAEPNLIAMDGQQASFLAGGEYPIPVLQSGGGGSGGAPSVTILFKEYGVRLNFKPTIIDEDHIRLELEPEVSTLDYANGIKFEGFLIPALRSRRAKTGVELRDGQSFALAGLLDNNERRTLSKVPIAGDIPILGALFKSKEYQKQETELVFIVTTQIVKPVNRDDLPQMRGIDGLKTGSPLGVDPKGDGIKGQSGFSTGTNSTRTEQQSLPEAAAPSPAAQPVNQKQTAPTLMPTTNQSVTSTSSTTQASKADSSSASAALTPTREAKVGEPQ